ncbi:MAG TPA: NADPH-dependent glutamate synthase [Candidatus Latescibacteria bacterium]|nr:NADPH-dependent glutamate synthase [Candidatus Latescibacterota bacterium]
MARVGTIPRQRMPEQDPEVRIHNFDEVPLGYTPELARREAERCLQCKVPQCMKGCPVEVDIPGFIRLVREGDFLGAARKIKETNNLPAICGRVCPQETQCEQLCVVGKRYEPVAVGRLERFAADYEREHGAVDAPPLPPPTGKKVAVVGSGPSGLTAAADLAKMGHKVVIFEGLHVPGGVLVYGIPEFRLPKRIVKAEVDFVRSLGVEIRTDWVIGKIRTVDELLGEYDAVYVATGAGAPTFMGIPGENLNGVYSANEYLTRVNLMRAYQFPEADTPVRRGRKVAVIGGGNVAMDAARTARRLGAEVIVIYRRSRAEMPARLEEVHHAEEEGVRFQFLTNPVQYLGNEEGWVVAAECIRMELGEPDASGRRRPVPIPGSEFALEVDQVIVAIGTHANPLVPSTTKSLKLNKWGYIVADPETGTTSKEGVFAGGDIVTGAATVIEAMGAGKKAARAIDAYLRRLR